jgi:hypothetical protein
MRISIVGSKNSIRSSNVPVLEVAQDPLNIATWWDILPSLSQLFQMCGPAFDYTFEDFLNDASQEEWDEWESKAAVLELPLDYYLQEFVACAS